LPIHHKWSRVKAPLTNNLFPPHPIPLPQGERGLSKFHSSLIREIMPSIYLIRPLYSRAEMPLANNLWHHKSKRFNPVSGSGFLSILLSNGMIINSPVAEMVAEKRCPQNAFKSGLAAVTWACTKGLPSK
jgi:hypothetical protein